MSRQSGADEQEPVRAGLEEGVDGAAVSGGFTPAGADQQAVVELIRCLDDPVHHLREERHQQRDEGAGDSGFPRDLLHRHMLDRVRPPEGR